jgi:hypothetical protein
VSVVCFQVEVFVAGRSLVQRSHTECCVLMSVIKVPRQRGSLGPLGLSTHGGKSYIAFYMLMCSLGKGSALRELPVMLNKVNMSVD